MKKRSKGIKENTRKGEKKTNNSAREGLREGMEGEQVKVKKNKDVKKLRSKGVKENTRKGENEKVKRKG